MSPLRRKEHNRDYRADRALGQTAGGGVIRRPLVEAGVRDLLVSVWYRCTVQRKHQRWEQMKSRWRFHAKTAKEDGRNGGVDKRQRREARTRATPKLLFVNSRGVDGEGVPAGAL